MKLVKIRYEELNARQQENFNFQKISAVFAEYGFVTFRLSDDWQGADFIALHISGEVLRVQSKGRLTFSEKYRNKQLHVAFADGDTWYLYDHDELLSKVLDCTSIGNTRSWMEGGLYHFPGLSKELVNLLAPYRITGDTKPLP